MLLILLLQILILIPLCASDNQVFIALVTSGVSWSEDSGRAGEGLSPQQEGWRVDLNCKLSELRV